MFILGNKIQAWTPYGNIQNSLLVFEKEKSGVILKKPTSVINN